MGLKDWFETASNRIQEWVDWGNSTPIGQLNEGLRQGAARPIQAGAEFIMDLAGGLWAEGSELLGGPEHSFGTLLHDSAEANFQEALGGLFGPDSGVGAVVGALPEPYRALHRPAVEAGMRFADTTATYAWQGIGTIQNLTRLPFSESYRAARGNIFEWDPDQYLQDAWDLAGARSLGQQTMLMASLPEDILDPTEYEPLFDSPWFNVGSGVLDFGKQIFLDPIDIVPALALNKARKTTTAVQNTRASQQEFLAPSDEAGAIQRGVGRTKDQVLDYVETEVLRGEETIRQQVLDEVQGDLDAAAEAKRAADLEFERLITENPVANDLWTEMQSLGVSTPEYLDRLKRVVTELGDNQLDWNALDDADRLWLEETVEQWMSSSTRTPLHQALAIRIIAETIEPDSLVMRDTYYRGERRGTRERDWRGRIAETRGGTLVDDPTQLVPGQKIDFGLSSFTENLSVAEHGFMDSDGVIYTVDTTETKPYAFPLDENLRNSMHSEDEWMLSGEFEVVEVLPRGRGELTFFDDIGNQVGVIAEGTEAFDRAYESVHAPGGASGLPSDLVDEVLRQLREREILTPEMFGDGYRVALELDDGAFVIVERNSNDLAPDFIEGRPSDIERIIASSNIQRFNEVRLKPTGKTAKRPVAADLDGIVSQVRKYDEASKRLDEASKRIEQVADAESYRARLEELDPARARIEELNPAKDRVLELRRMIEGAEATGQRLWMDANGQVDRAALQMAHANDVNRMMDQLPRLVHGYLARQVPGGEVGVFEDLVQEVSTNPELAHLADLARAASELDDAVGLGITANRAATLDTFARTLEELAKFADFNDGAIEGRFRMMRELKDGVRQLADEAGSLMLVQQGDINDLVTRVYERYVENFDPFRGPFANVSHVLDSWWREGFYSTGRSRGAVVSTTGDFDAAAAGRRVVERLAEVDPETFTSEDFNDWVQAEFGMSTAALNSAIRQWADADYGLEGVPVDLQPDARFLGDDVKSIVTDLEMDLSERAYQRELRGEAGDDPLLGMAREPNQLRFRNAQQRAVRLMEQVEAGHFDVFDGRKLVAGHVDINPPRTSHLAEELRDAEKKLDRVTMKVEALEELQREMLNDRKKLIERSAEASAERIRRTLFPRDPRGLEKARILALAPDRATREMMLKVILGDRDAYTEMMQAVDALRARQETAQSLLDEASDIQATPDGQLPLEFADEAKLDRIASLAMDIRSKNAIGNRQLTQYANLFDRHIAELNDLTDNFGIEGIEAVARDTLRQLNEFERLADLFGTAETIPRAKMLEPVSRMMRGAADQVRQSRVYRTSPFMGKPVRLMMSPFDKRAFPYVDVNDIDEVADNVRWMMRQAGMDEATQNAWAGRVAGTNYPEQRSALLMEANDAAIKHIAAEYGLPKYVANELSSNLIANAQLTAEVVAAASDLDDYLLRVADQLKVPEHKASEWLIDFKQKVDWDPLDPTGSLERVRLELADVVANRVDSHHIDGMLDRVQAGRKRSMQRNSAMRFGTEGRDLWADEHGVNTVVRPLFSTQTPNLVAVPDFTRLRRDIERYMTKELLPLDTSEWTKNANAARQAMDDLNSLVKANLIIRPAWALRVIGLDEGLRGLVEFGVLANAKNWGRNLQNLRKRYAAENPNLGRRAGLRGGSKAARMAKYSIPFGGGLLLGGFGPAGAALGATAVAAAKGVGKFLDRFDDLNARGYTPYTAEKYGRAFKFDGVFDDGGDAMKLRLANRNDAKDWLLDEHGRMRELVGDVRRWKTITPDSPSHLASWKHVLNNQVGRDPLGRRILEGWSDEQLVKWLRSDPDGIDLSARLPVQSADPYEWVQRARAEIDHLTGGFEPELVAWALEHKVTDKRLATKFPDDASRPNVNGPELDFSFGGGIGKTMGQWIDSAVKNIIDLPIDEMVRHPTLELFYKRDLQRQLDNFHEQGLYLDGLPDAERIRMQQRARDYAMGRTKDLMYEFAAKSEFHRMVRFLSPFFAAAEEAFKTWTRLAIENPVRVAVMTNLYRNLSEFPGYYEDDNGSGWIYFTLPEQAQALLDEGVFQGVIERGGEVRIPTESVNLIFNWNDLASGPGVRLAASEILKRRPDYENWLEWAVPFGLSEDAADALAGSSLRNAWSRVAKDEHYDALYASVLVDYITDVRLGLRDYDLTDTQDARKFLQDVDSVTESLYNFKVGVSLFSIAPIASVSPYEEYILIAREMRRTNPDGWFEDFYGEYGDELAALATGFTQTTNGMPPTQMGYEEYKKHQPLIEEYPEWGSFIIGTSSANDEATAFSSAVYEWQQRQESQPGSGEPIRRIKTPLELIEEPDIRSGWLEYVNAMDWLDTQLAERGLVSYQQKGAEDLAQTKSQVVSYLKQQYPPWGREFEQRDSGAFRERLQGAKAIVADPSLRQRPDVAAMKQYLDLREEYLARIEQRGMAKSLFTVSNQDLADDFEREVWNLLSTNPSFSRVYYRYFETDPMTLESR